MPYVLRCRNGRYVLANHVEQISFPLQTNPEPLARMLGWIPTCSEACRRNPDCRACCQEAQDYLRRRVNRIVEFRPASVRAGKETQ